jgi:hypothetical protein
MCDMGAMGRMGEWGLRARAGCTALCLLHKGGVAMLACSLDSFRLPCEGKSGLLRGFTLPIFFHDP